MVCVCVFAGVRVCGVRECVDINFATFPPFCIRCAVAGVTANTL